MNFDEYAKAAARTSSPFSDIVNGALGLAGEAGEVAELVKKHKYHGQDIDLDALAKEMGDVLWYLAEICNQSGLSLDAIASGNIAKLRERHPGKFDPSYHDAVDVLAGYEWDGSRFISDDASAVYAAAYSGLWVVWHTDGNTRISWGTETGDWGKRCAEAALRAHLEGKQCS
tara:strand:+ start:198 stop:713 length:516 start_codon:yes stop_codon:yes gene_type:complete